MSKPENPADDQHGGVPATPPKQREGQSGSGAQTALQAMLRTRRMGVKPDPDITPPEDPVDPAELPPAAAAA